AAAAAAIAIGYELLTGKATKLREEADKLVTTLDESGKKFAEANDPTITLAADMEKLTPRLKAFNDQASVKYPVDSAFAAILGLGSGSASEGVKNIFLLVTAAGNANDILQSAMQKYHDAAIKGIKDIAAAQAEATRQFELAELDKEQNARDDERKVLTGIQALAAARGAVQLAREKAAGDDLAAIKTTYDLEVQRNNAAYVNAAMEKDANLPQLLAIRNADAELARLKEQADILKFENDVWKSLADAAAKLTEETKKANDAALVGLNLAILRNKAVIPGTDISGQGLGLQNTTGFADPTLGAIVGMDGNDTIVKGATEASHKVSQI